MSASGIVFSGLPLGVPYNAGILEHIYDRLFGEGYDDRSIASLLSRMVAVSGADPNYEKSGKTGLFGFGKDEYRQNPFLSDDPIEEADRQVDYVLDNKEAYQFPEFDQDYLAKAIWGSVEQQRREQSGENDWLDTYMNKWLWPAENSIKAGYKNGRWGVYSDSAGRNIGPGLHEGSFGDVLDYSGNTSYSTEDINRIVRGDLERRVARIKTDLNDIGYGDLWDSLSDGGKAVMLDISYNVGVGGGSPKKWRRLVDSLATGNNERALSEMRSGDDRRMAIRQNMFNDFGGEYSEVSPFAKGGKIHIKPENRGKFTALKERTGHSASWFKAHGTPAQKKMATFALNSRKWKHAEGGSLRHMYDGESESTQQMMRNGDGNIPAPDWSSMAGLYWNPELESKLQREKYNSDAATTYSNIALNVASPEELKQLAQSQDPGEPSRPVFDDKLRVWTLDGKVLPISYLGYGNDSWFVARYNAGNPEPDYSAQPVNNAEDIIWKNIYERALAHDMSKMVQKYPYTIFARNAHYDNVEHRNEGDPELPYIPEKKIRIDDAGKFSGIEVSSNQLDSLAKYAGMTNLPNGVSVPPFLGIAASETGIGTYPGTTFYSPSEMRNYTSDVKKARKQLNDDSFGRYHTASEVMNNHHYWDSNAWADLLGQSMRSAGIMMTPATHWPTQGYVDTVIDERDFSDEIEKSIRKGFNYTKRQDKNKKFVESNSVSDVINQFYSGDMNRGMPGTDARIMTADSLMWNSPQIRKWWEESGKKWFEYGRKSQK